MGARFNFDLRTMFGDGEAIAEETVNEQHKFDGGQRMKTSRSASPFGDPTALTIFSVSEIMQQVPAFASPQETLAKYQDYLDTSVALGIKHGGDFNDIIKTGTLSPEILQQVDALRATEEIIDGESAGAKDPFLNPEVKFEDLEKDERIVYIDDSFREAAKNGEVHPYLLWIIKFIITNGGAPLAIVGGRIRGREDGGRKGLHSKGWAVDIAQMKDGPTLLNNPWVTTVCTLLDSVPAPHKPSEVGGPAVHAGAAGITWFSTPETADRLHIAYYDPPLAEVPPGAAAPGGATAPAAAIGEVAVGAAPARTDSRNNIDLVRVALTQVGDRYRLGAQPNVDDADPDEFDCSALIQWACARVGKTDMPRNSEAQRDHCKAGGGSVSVEEGLRTVGTLIWRSGHVALCLGDGTLVEAPNPRSVVRRVNIWFSDELYKIPGINYTAPPATGAVMGDAGQVDNYLKGLRKHESTGVPPDYGNYTARNPQSPHASGAYQYIPNTWANYGGFGEAKDAPKELQDERARKDAMAGFNAFKDWRLVAMQHYYPKFRQERNYDGVPPGNKWTMNQYADKVCEFVAGAAVTQTYGTTSTTATAPGNLAKILVDGGVTIKETDGWQNRGNSTFTPFGIMLHHTVGAATGEMPSLPLLINGRSDLAGPLCQIGLGRSGTAYIVAGGRANHAGAGGLNIGQRVLDEVKNGQPHTGGDATGPARGGPGGNQFFYGIEVENIGYIDEAKNPKQPYPQVQIDALVKICAAICNYHKWNEHHIIHHREWTSDKIDMGYRGDIRGMVKAKLTWNRPTGGATPAL